jgi:hypothetical protein
VFQSISVISLVALIAGCSGGMNGVLRGSGEQVSVASYAGLCLDSLQITLPDGETFIGYIPTPEGDGEADPFCVSPYEVASSGSFGSGGEDPDSILFSDRLNMMRCEINFRKPGRWGAAGGSGICQLSDSRVIDVK